MGIEILCPPSQSLSHTPHPTKSNPKQNTQVGVPEYRISQMTSNGGNIIDAYGFVNVVSPSGLPIRAIVGISPDPIMFVAVNCLDVEESREFYNNLGFVEQVRSRW